MANASTAFGFRHIGYLGGGAPDYAPWHYTISSTLGSVIAFGDLVTYTTNNVLQVANTPVLATTNPCVGVFQGCEYIPLGGGPPVWSPAYPGTAAAAATAYVIDAPNALFLAASIASGTAPISSASIGNAINIGTSGVAATTFGGGISQMVVNGTSITAITGATDSALPFKIVDLYQGLGNGSDPTTQYNWVVVTFLNQLNKVT